MTGASTTVTPVKTVLNTTGGSALLEMNISGSSPGGTVTITENGIFLGSASVVNGHASIHIEGLGRGVHTIMATYSGDGANPGTTVAFTVKVQDLAWLPAVLEVILGD